MTKVVALIAALMLLMLVGLSLFPPPQSDYSHSPVAEQELQVSHLADVHGISYASSLHWQADKQAWLIGTLTPQTVMKNGTAQFAYLDPSHQLELLQPLSSSGDLADLTSLEDKLAAISSDGKLLLFASEQGSWQLANRRSMLGRDLRHKTAALAWDTARQVFYSCEQLGVKRCYRANREAQLQSEFELHFTDSALSEQLKQLEVSSMSFHQDKLYLLSERFSTLLQISPTSGLVEASWRLAQTEQAKAIASNGTDLVLMTVIREQPERVKLWKIVW